MPEPTLIILGGLALYSMLTKGSGGAGPTAESANDHPLSDGAAGTGPNAPLATATGNANGISLAQAATLVASGQDTPITVNDIAVPSDLVNALDVQTANLFRVYARLNPTDFQVFLDRYADRVQLRNDLMFQVVTGRIGPGDIQPTPAMLIGMGSAAYKVAQAFNGVAAGKSVDIFGVAASAAGAMPGMNPDFVSSLQAAAMSYRAINSLADVVSIASANGVSITNFSAMTAAGAYPGLAALPLAGVLMAVGLVVDIGFTIIGDKPDLQKAIDVALDVASLAVLFIPVIGVVIAIVIQLVKFIIDLFGDSLFGGGMSHEQREILEAAAYGQRINPIYKQLADSYTPRELYQTIVRWGAYECGGQQLPSEQAQTMLISLRLKAGDLILRNGLPFTVPADTMLTPGHQPCSWVPWGLTDDDQAFAFAVYASTNGVVADAILGVAESRELQFEEPVQNIVQTRTQPMREFIVKHGLTLDQIDQIAAEYRAQPRLNAMGAAFGFPTWQDFFAWVVEAEWRQFNQSVTHGSLIDFARGNGYGTMYAFRAGALATYDAFYARYEHALATAQAMLADLKLQQSQANTAIATAQAAFTGG